MPGQKNDRDANVRSCQLPLKIEAARSWQSDVQDQATDGIAALVQQKIAGCRKHLRVRRITD